MGIITIDGLKVRGILGAHPWERKNKQDLIITIRLSYDAKKASQSDRLKDALDYEALTQGITELIERSKYQLLEKLTAKVLAAVMSKTGVIEAFVRIDKPQAIPNAQTVGFELSERKN